MVSSKVQEERQQRETTAKEEDNAFWRKLIKSFLEPATEDDANERQEQEMKTKEELYLLRYESLKSHDSIH